jgi:3' terminal RNA ribose 2'-O-methyltransferase Hen1
MGLSPSASHLLALTSPCYVPDHERKRAPVCDSDYLVTLVPAGSQAGQPVVFHSSSQWPIDKMLLTIRTTAVPATDLGYLLHKNPARAQSFELSFGHAHVFYPEASPESCTAALLLDVDPIGLVRGRKGPPGEGGQLEHYVNDRPYVASSFLSVALAQVLRSAMGGQCKERPELAQSRLPLEARLGVVPCREGEDFLRRLFEPLGYEVTVVPHPLEETTPEWGMSRYFTLTLRADCRLSDLLTHLYVLVPVLDGDKHYWVGDEEVDKLLKHGDGWLGAHPERDLIAKRYLRHQHGLVRDAIDRLISAEDPLDEETDGPDEEALEAKVNLHDQRLSAVLVVLKSFGAKRVLDLGCGEGRLLRLLLEDRAFEEIVGMDVSFRALEAAKRRLKLDHLPAMVRDRLRLVHGSLMYRDSRLTGFDAAAVVEVIEHLDAPRLAAFERVLFEFAKPRVVILTTPNVEYNVKWETLPAGKFRHKDHRFEWTRAQLQEWAGGIGERFGYQVRFLPVGDPDPALGTPTQMAIFTRDGAS